MASRVTISRLRQVGHFSSSIKGRSFLHSINGSHLWDVFPKWSRAYSKVPGNKTTSSTVKSSSAMNTVELGDSFYAETLALLTQTTIGPLQPWLSEIAETVDLSPDQTLTICDYGSADGSSSLMSVQNIMGTVRQRFGSQQQIMVIYEDQPENNYGPVFLRAHGLLPGSERPCLKDDPNVFVTACATDFYSQCLPDNTVNIGIASSSFYLLSTIPCKLKHAVICHNGGSEEELSIWRDVARRDWERLLLHRAREMVAGSYLVIATFSSGDSAQNLTPWPATDPGKGRPIGEPLQMVLEDMVKEHRITWEEAQDVNIPGYYRTEEEIRAPFQSPDSPVRKAGLELVETKQKNFDCILRVIHQRDFDEFDVAHFASTGQQNLRSFTGSAVMSSFSKHRPPEEGMALTDEYYQRLEDKLAADPENYGAGFTLLYTLLRKK